MTSEIYVLLFATFVVGAYAGFSLGYWRGLENGREAEYRKWLARRWHRPGCACDGDKHEPQ